MTIVIQHRFWDLKVEDDGFSVGLSLRRRAGDAASCRSPRSPSSVDPAVDFA